MNLSGESTVKVTIGSENYDTRIFKVSNIITKNNPEGMRVAKETQSLSAVTVIGPREDLDNLQENDLVASADLSDVSKEGSYSKTAIISISGHGRVWCFGTNEIQVVVSERKEESSSRGESPSPSDNES